MVWLTVHHCLNSSSSTNKKCSGQSQGGRSLTDTLMEQILINETLSLNCYQGTCFRLFSGFTLGKTGHGIMHGRKEELLGLYTVQLADHVWGLLIRWPTSRITGKCHFAKLTLIFFPCFQKTHFTTFFIKLCDIIMATVKTTIKVFCLKFFSILNSIYQCVVYPLQCEKICFLTNNKINVFWPNTMVSIPSLFYISLWGHIMYVLIFATILGNAKWNCV